MKHLEKLLILKALPRVGNSKINNEYKSILTKDYSLEEFYDVLKRKAFSPSDINAAATSMKEIMDLLEENPSYKAITIYDSQYPEALKELGNSAPPYIFALGNLEALDRVSLGIIGTRHPDKHVIDHAPALVKHCIEKISPAIVSGLAIGCDTIGHKAALENNAPTIALLPCGFNKIKPKAKMELADEIVENGGLLISEYPPNTEETRFTPVQRDALIAALSNKIITLQCGEKSGTMHTLDTAHTLSRPIGCYMPSIQEGDFAGHTYAISKYKASALKSFDDLDTFLESSPEKPDKQEQLSFI